MSSLGPVLGDDDLVTSELPSYVPPPPWIPPDKRRGNADYDTDLMHFLPKRIILHRQHFKDVLGFNVRGGADNSCGIYISRVMETSEACRLGLKEGHQILSVNDVSFGNIEHARAVEILKSSLDVHMVIRLFPHGYMRTYDRVDEGGGSQLKSSTHGR